MKQPDVVTNRVRRWATLQEAAEYVCCNPKTITRRFADGTLSRYRLGGASWSIWTSWTQ